MFQSLLPHRRRLPTMVLLVVLLLGRPNAYGQSCLTDQEPNDDPATAQPLTTCATGTLTDGDQDLYRFDVTDPLSSWQLILDGVPRALTTAELFSLGDDGTPRAIYSISSPKGDEISSPSLLLEPGAYLLGVSPAGGTGPYTLTLQPGDPLPTATESEPNDSRETGSPVAGAFALRGDFSETTDWFIWTLSEQEAAATWQLTAQSMIGEPVSIFLYDDDRQLLTNSGADRLGRAELYDLRLPAGTYLVSLDGNRTDGSSYTLTTTAAEPLPPNREAEPNDALDQALIWTSGTPQRGRLGAINDDDTFVISISEEESDGRFTLELAAEGRADRNLCLLQPDVELRHCRTGLGEVALPDLVLTPGDYFVQIDGNADPDAFYELTRRAGDTPDVGEEREPNDTYRFASPMANGRRAFGRLNGDEWDVFRLDVTGQPQLWRLQVVGDGLNRLALYNAAGDVTDQIINNNPARRIRLNNLFLLPGSHFIGVRGTDADYQLIAVPLGPPPAGLELEPNSTVDQANDLGFDQPRIGLLSEVGDTDVYRITLPAAEQVRLTVTPANDGNVQVRVLGEGNFRLANYVTLIEPGRPFEWQTRLPAGEYWVEISSDIISDSAYRVHLERLDPFLPLDDLEPNDRRELAAPFPPSFVARGNVQKHSDVDWYQLPEITTATDLTLSLTNSGDSPSLTLYDQDGTNLSNQVEWDRETLVLTGRLTPGTTYFVRVLEDGPYEVRLDLDGVTPPQQEPSTLPGTVTLALDDEQAAAFWPTGQQLTGRLTLSSELAPLAERLEWHTSHYLIQTPLVVETVSSGDGQELRFVVNLAADIPTGTYPLTVHLADGAGGRVTAQATIDFDPAAPPVGVQRTWSVPPAILGGLNAAALPLGGVITTSDGDIAERQLNLHDGITPLNNGFHYNFNGQPLELTVDLAGENPLPVGGILLNPQGRGWPHEKAARFELDLSVDGVTYETVLSDVLQPLDIEQPFTLDQPVNARFARLRLLTNHNGNQGPIALGEWKVVIEPGISWLGEINLLDPSLGGQLVNTDPQPSGTNAGVSYLVADEASAQLDLREEPSATWVFGFHHGRAAQVSRIEWVENPNTDPADRLTSVAVQVSSDSPVGPWQEVMTTAISPGTTTITLTEPVWARYVRLVASSPDGTVTRPLGPDVVRIFERPTSDQYFSILGEWGHYGRDAIFEAVTPPSVPQAAGADSNNSRGDADPVLAGEPVVGQVVIAQDVDWYRLDVPADHNAVVLELSGTPTVDVQAFFEDEAGQLLPAAVENPDGGRRVVTVSAPPDSTVYFRIEEPPRSVVFAWDTSGSVAPYVDTIYNALTRFVEGVTPGLETANFLPFGSDLLLETWGEQPTVLQQALTNYPRGEGSSNAEETLLTGTDALAFQEGTRAIVLITDAVSPGYNKTAELWRAFEAVQPRIFTLSINPALSSGTLPADEQDLMQNWAAVNGGYYDFMRTQGEMAVAFERASAWLRRPAGYTFVARSAFIEPPGPGSLQLLSSSTGENAAASASLLGDTAVEIIVDASGSMRQPLDGSTRIEVARGVLAEIISDVLPDDLPVALRVFGNREGNLSCRTDLEIPLQPLDRAQLAAAVAAIEPQPDANTALGASLALVPEDLADASGPKLVILLTDGEETCGADPEQVITDLRAAGIDVRVNIVGFAIDNAALKETFARWAEAGGGAYFDAADPAALTESLSRALRTPYRVLDGAGVVVAEGVVDGEPVSLPAGVYTVEVQTDPLTVLEAVVVPGEEEVVVRIQAR